LSQRYPDGSPRASAPRRGSSRLLLASLTLALLEGCRAAPGPEQCLLLAEAVFRQRAAPPEGGRRRDHTPDPLDSLPLGGSASQAPERDSFVRDCLTMPYDQQLVDCALPENELGQKRCWTAYLRRYEERYGAHP
jgi:hypothetical protein